MSWDREHKRELELCLSENISTLTLRNYPAGNRILGYKSFSPRILKSRLTASSTAEKPNDNVISELFFFWWLVRPSPCPWGLDFMNKRCLHVRRLSFPVPDTVPFELGSLSLQFWDKLFPFLDHFLPTIFCFLSGTSFSLILPGLPDTPPNFV